MTDFDILHDAHNSLAKLKTNHLDIYMLHRDDPSVPVGPIVDVLNRLYDEGKIGAFGGSNWTVERTEEANNYALKHGLQPFTVASPNFGLADQLGDPWGGGCEMCIRDRNAAEVGTGLYLGNHIRGSGFGCGGNCQRRAPIRPDGYGRISQANALPDADLRRMPLSACFFVQ